MVVESSFFVFVAQNGDSPNSLLARCLHPPISLNGMVERMPASPTMDRILRLRKGLGTATEFSGVQSAHTDLHKRLPDMG